ncbi:hypothetical protein D2T29_15875 [Sinirhodobacter populi]|uniref:Uncharacterized protein n=1 Tax=Paenirhodobacter populi TaxID=2306993 RepID=A0A443K7F8_9RHOB|nr:hypothetical protein [Sinirhodobacter populi]RWR28708.1 hypothetical protein D2T29_15875 [Sinirhodobacter populi]
MDKQVTVTLSGPAKVGSAWFMPGDQVTVDEALVSQLPVDPGAVHISTMSSAEAIDVAVAERLDAAVYDATAALEGQLAVSQARATGAEQQCDALRVRGTELEAMLAGVQTERDTLQVRVAELESQLAAATGPQLASGKDVADTEAAKVRKATSGKETKG